MNERFINKSIISFLMTLEQVRKISKDIVDVIVMIPIGAVLTMAGTHMIPHVYAESNPGKPFGQEESRLFPTRESWRKINTKEKLQMAALYTGGLAGLIGEVGVYYHHVRETHPGVLAIPVVTNTISGLYEFYKSRRR